MAETGSFGRNRNCPHIFLCTLWDFFLCCMFFYSGDVLLSLHQIMYVTQASISPNYELMVTWRVATCLYISKNTTFKWDQVIGYFQLISIFYNERDQSLFSIIFFTLFFFLQSGRSLFLWFFQRYVGSKCATFKDQHRLKMAVKPASNRSIKFFQLITWFSN